MQLLSDLNWVSMKIPDKNIEDTGLFVMPNPCNRNAKVLFKLPPLTKFELKIYDCTGKKIFATHRNTETFEWNLREETGIKVNSGVYFYSILANDCNWTGKIVIK